MSNVLTFPDPWEVAEQKLLAQLDAARWALLEWEICIRAGKDAAEIDAAKFTAQQAVDKLWSTRP